MKNYINHLHSIISDIHFWNLKDFQDKKKIISKFLINFDNFDVLTEYFDKFDINISKKTLNSYLKSVSND